MLQETKLKLNEKIACASLSDFQVYYLNKLIKEGTEETEALSVKVFLEEIEARVITAYGPQENALKEKKLKFWEFLEEEVNCAEMEGDGLIIQMDGNLHAGSSLIQKDPNKQNNNGFLFCEFLERNPQLIVVNTLDLCEGVITRKRILENKTEEAILDFYIVNEQMRRFLKKMKIDEDKEMNLLNLAQMKQNRRIIETDHNGLLLEMELDVGKSSPERQEIFNFRNKVCQETFYEETDKNEEILDCFKTELPFKVQSMKWKKSINNILHKCFRKIRISKRKEVSKTDNLLKERVQLKKEIKHSIIDDAMKEKIEKRIRDIEDDIGEDIANENRNVVLETLKQLGDGNNLNGSGRKRLWEILKKKFPKSSQAMPVGKKGGKGNLVTNHRELKKLYLKTYTQRMRNRPIKDELVELKQFKDELFNLRLKLASRKKSEPWTMEDLDNALKGLKKNKARDPHGWVNELFTEGVAGKNLKLSLLQFFNKMKFENEIPEFVQLADITTIYKGKGPKSELINDRGIFIVTLLRTIMMRLIYLDYYPQLDKSMSDSQVGARKGKNIRNHIWIVNGIISDVLSSKSKKPVDIQIYDYKQCFDSLWLQECMNDLYSAGLNDDKFALLYNVNSKVDIAVKTPVGKTDRQSIHNVIAQGDVFGPMFCSKQVDTFGQECLDEGKYTYMYRGEVEIPPLSMVDDVLCVSECGFKTSMMHAFI